MHHHLETIAKAGFDPLTLPTLIGVEVDADGRLHTSTWCARGITTTRDVELGTLTTEEFCDQCSRSNQVLRALALSAQFEHTVTARPSQAADELFRETDHLDLPPGLHGWLRKQCQRGWGGLKHNTLDSSAYFSERLRCSDALTAELELSSESYRILSPIYDLKNNLADIWAGQRNKGRTPQQATRALVRSVVSSQPVPEIDMLPFDTAVIRADDESLVQWLGRVWRGAVEEILAAFVRDIESAHDELLQAACRAPEDTLVLFAKDSITESEESIFTSVLSMQGWSIGRTSEVFCEVVLGGDAVHVVDPTVTDRDVEGVMEIFLTLKKESGHRRVPDLFLEAVTLQGQPHDTTSEED